jgi:predicted nucleotidyltransferase component of viral defense system
LNALEASNFESAPLHKYVKEADKCFEKARAEKKRGKASTLYHLTKYLQQKK